MADFRFDVFKGIRPRVTARLLPRGEAQTAQNAQLGSGALEPWKQRLDTGTDVPSNTTSIHRMRNGGTPIWLTSTNDVDYARGPVPNDALERTYYTGEAQPRMTYTTIAASDYRYLGIPAPATAPDVDGEDLPEDTITGSMTAASMVTNYVKGDFVIEDNLPANINDGWHMSDGSGYSTVGTIRVYNMDFYIGQEIRIASVVDANTVTIEDANGATYLAAGTDRARSTGGVLHYRTDDTGTTRDGYFRFYIPNGVRVTMTAHNLQAGDVIRVTSIPSTIALQLTQTATASAGVFYGAESDNGLGNAGSNTWPAAPISVTADDFWIDGARAYPFVDVWAGLTGAASATNFTILGGFDWEISERDGIAYDDIVADIESRVYVYTYVSELGEEGPPSPASDVVTIPSGGDVVVDNFATAPSTQRNITHRRIYRANTGTDQTIFQFVVEIAVGTTTYTDDVADLDLGEVLQTESWDPPDTNLRGIIALPNGGMAGFFGKTVAFSEPNYPHAWPPEYQIAVDYDVVGLGVVPNGVAILTRGPVCIASGDHPRAMSTRYFNNSQACVSKRSIANTTDGVIYAAPDGLAFVGAGGFRLLTEEHARKREWQVYDPEDFEGFWHDGQYVAFTDAGTVHGLVFDMSDEVAGLTTLNLPALVVAGHLSAEDDTLYLVFASDVNLYEWNAHASNKLTTTWKSGKILCEHPLNLGAARIHAETYVSLTFKLYNDRGTLVTTRTITSDEVIRLPSGYITSWFEIQIESTDVVNVVHVAETVEELLKG